MHLSQERLIAAWQPLRQHHVGALLQQVKEASATARDASWISLLQLPPVDVGPIIAGVEAAIEEGRETALDEARRQSTEVAARAAAGTLPHHADKIDAYAESAERLLAASLVQTASREAFRLVALQRDVDVETAVARVLGDTSTRYERDILQGMATGGVNEGRYHVMAAILGQPAGGLLEAAASDFHIITGTPKPVDAKVYALEILDGNTCDECAAIDGQEYASLEDARLDYPGIGGGYIACAGRERCRGSLVIVYPEAASFNDTIGKPGGPLKKPSLGGGAPPDETPIPLPTPQLNPKTLPPVSSINTWGSGVTDISQVGSENLAFAYNKIGALDPASAGMKALGHYVSEGYYPMNTLLRSGIVPPGFDAQAVQARVTALTDLMALGVRVKGDLVTSRLMAADVENFVGRVIEDKGFMSTSLDPTIAASFDAQAPPAGMEQVLVRLHTREGKRFLPGSYDEREMIFGPGTRYAIISESAPLEGKRVFEAIILKPGEGLIEAPVEATLPAGVKQPTTWQTPSVELQRGVDALRTGENFKASLRNGGAVGKEFIRAIDHYMNYGHTAINAVFRQSIPVAEMDAGAIAEAKAIKLAFETPGLTSTFAEDQLLYRGLMMEPSFGVGSTLTDQAVVSTSINPKGAAEFARPKKGAAPDGKVPVILRLHTPQGTRFVTGNDFEGEAILGPGTKYVVVRESQAELQIAGGKYTPAGVKTYDAIALPPDAVPVPGEVPVAPKLPPTWDQDKLVETAEQESMLRRARLRLNKATKGAPWGTPMADGRTALDAYTGSSYKDMNRVLRGIRPLEHLSETSARKLINDLAEFFKTDAVSEAREPVMLHRGTSIDAGANPVGSVLVDEGFMSTSSNFSTAASFLSYPSRPGREKIMLRVHVQPGARHLPANSGEKEILFPPGTKVLVVQQRGTINYGGKTARVFDAILDTRATQAAEPEALGVQVTAGKPAGKPKAWKGATDAGTPVAVHDPQKVGGSDWTKKRLQSLFQSPKLTELGLQVDVSVGPYAGGPGRMIINARIKDELTGKEVGSVVRIWTPGSKSIEHAEFKLAEGYNGQGIARDLLKSSQEVYYKLGIKEATVEATGSAGRYAWARYGFDFAQPDLMVPTMREAFRKKLLAEAAQQLVIEQDAVTKRRLLLVVQDPTALDRIFPKATKLIDAAEHSWDFAGLAIDENKVTLSGSQVMRTGPDWSGILDLSAATPSKKVFLAYTK